ncbi:MAG: transglycosylase SLT domain-containing protein [Polyangiales bacterium]
MGGDDRQALSNLHPLASALLGLLVCALFSCPSQPPAAHANPEPEPAHSKPQAAAHPPDQQPTAAHAALPPTEAAAREAEDPALVTLRERVRAHDVEGALTQLAVLPERPELQYLRARLHEQKGRFTEALASAPRDEATLPDLVAKDLRRRRALWLARTGQCAEARPLLHELAHEDGSDNELTLRAAECALTQRDATAALALLRNGRGPGARRFESRLLLAKALVASGDKTAAIRELRALWVELPTHARAGEVQAQLKKLARGFRLTYDEALDRAEHWLDAARPDPAWAELQKVTFPAAKSAREKAAIKAAKTRHVHLKGMALFRMRSRYGEAAKVLKQAAKLGGATEAEDAYHAAQALARADRDADAVREYYAFADRYPKDRLVTDALRNAAWLELRHNLPGGEEHMRAILKRAERSGSKQALGQALWDLALYAFSHQQCDQARPLFERYAATAEDPMVKGRGLYWAGRCASLLGDRPQAVALYRNAMAVEPLHWYSLLARARIAAEGEDPGPPFLAVSSGVEPEPLATPTPALAAFQLPPAAQLYANIGLMPDAVQALRGEEKQLREGRSDASLLRLIAAYHSLGEFNRPYHLAEREHADAVQRPPETRDRAVWEALFPKAFPRELDAAVARSVVAPELVLAVMRRESGYNPTVVSNADAIGLMQLIERTAQQLSQELGMKHFERAMLYEPETNVALGAAYLAKLVQRYRGQAVPAIAAYNAGEHRVDPWLERVSRPGRTVELDRFVEEIPIEQTRNYVRKVVANWARYRYLDKRDHTWPLDLALSFER